MIMVMMAMMMMAIMMIIQLIMVMLIEIIVIFIKDNDDSTKNPDCDLNLIVCQFVDWIFSKWSKSSCKQFSNAPFVALQESKYFLYFLQQKNSPPRRNLRPPSLCL